MTLLSHYVLDQFLNFLVLFFYQKLMAVRRNRAWINTARVITRRLAHVATKLECTLLLHLLRLSRYEHGWCLRRTIAAGVTELWSINHPVGIVIYVTARSRHATASLTYLLAVRHFCNLSFNY